LRHGRISQLSGTARRQWLILVGLALGVTVTNGFARFAYGLILPAMKQDMGWNYTQAGWLNTANALGYVVGAVVTFWLIHLVSPSRLFSFGVLTTAISLMATGFDDTLFWQSTWRILAGVFGAMSFVTGGALSAALFRDDPGRNALAIALFFGFGGGLGILLAGAALPLMLDANGPAAWRLAWMLVGGVSLLFCPPSLWAAEQLHMPATRTVEKAVLPMRRMMGEIGGYACFALGYIVYLTFLAAWMQERNAGPWMVSTVWVVLGAGIVLSPFVWRPVLVRFANGVPLVLVLTGIGAGSALPILLPGTGGLIGSAVVFGLAVFMAPGAVTNFIRQNLPQHSWGVAISMFTVVFAVAQTIGPIAAGALGDLTGDIGDSLLAAAGVLLLGAVLAGFQKQLAPDQPDGG
jgi:MFS family permease